MEVSDCIMILRPTDRKQHIDVGHTVPQWLKFAVEARSHDSWVFLVSKMFFFEHVHPGLRHHVLYMSIPDDDPN